MVFFAENFVEEYCPKLYCDWTKTDWLTRKTFTGKLIFIPLITEVNCFSSVIFFSRMLLRCVYSDNLLFICSLAQCHKISKLLTYFSQSTQTVVSKAYTTDRKLNFEWLEFGARFPSSFFKKLKSYVMFKMDRFSVRTDAYAGKQPETFLTGKLSV